MLPNALDRQMPASMKFSAMRDTDGEEAGSAAAGALEPPTLRRRPGTAARLMHRLHYVCVGRFVEATNLYLRA